MIEYHCKVMIEAVFLDVGGTLVFPSVESMLAPLLERGISPSADQLKAAEASAKHAIDEFYASPRPNSSPRDYWGDYYTCLLRSLDIEDTGLKPALVARSKNSGNWSRVLPGTRTVLQRLREGYRLAVISNSDGHVSDLLYRLELGDLFESITDSGRIGHEKPDIRIFKAALASMRVQPETAVYVGDIYSVDYLGSQSAGMNPILLDSANAYSDTDFKRISCLAELPDCLLSMGSKRPGR